MSDAADAIEADVAIVGGGIVGAAIAHFLAPHRKVVLLEAESHPGYHATGRSAAVVVEAYEGPAVRALTACAKAYLVEAQHRLSPAGLLTPRGQLIVAAPDRADALQDRFADLGDVAGVELLDGLRARQLCAALRPEAVAAAIWEAGAYDLDVDGLLQAFLRGARSHGLDLRTGARVEALDHDGSAWRIATSGLTVWAPVVVNAAGAWTGQIAAMAGAMPLSIQPLLRTALTVDAPPGHDVRHWPFVVTIDEDVYFKPDGTRLMVSLADERPAEPCDAWADDMDVAIAVDRLQNLIDIAVERVSHSWAGLRTFLPDRNPAFGWDARVPGFYWAAGVGGFGVQTSPALGMFAAAQITDAPLPDGISEDVATRIAPGRFG